MEMEIRNKRNKIEKNEQPRFNSKKGLVKNPRLFEVYLMPLVAFVLFILIWQFGVQITGAPHYILPKPTDIFNAAIENSSNMFLSVVRTISAALIGFIISVVVGITGAIIMASSKILQKSLYPYAILLQTVPIVAIAPIIVIWFGSGINAIVVIAFIIGFFPMLSNTLVGLNSTDHNMINLFQMYSASKWQIMFKLRLPAALPYIMAGLKISCTLAIVGAIVGEYVAGIGGGQGGLGYAITVAAARLQTPYLFALGLASSILGILFFLVVNAFSKWVLSSWHESEMKIEN
ncbi:ABC transporter permease [Cytobacillus dafuensis]|uniref:ABC transporter permease n=1 Tax=Cytobacillus dafuensis TaxID=1742359 RepID=A0A5B8Z1Z5_CYTDA|nr:ABC transporter permease [Cytobacillus dafuensis]QED47044.1 ABC transporter permease [Cytobacillus dafuensis]